MKPKTRVRVGPLQMPDKMPQFKLALITGATSGIGLAMSHFLAKRGISLIITGRQSERLSELSDVLKTLCPLEFRSTFSVFFSSADLKIEKERDVVVSLIQKHIPDLVINNAGFGLYGDVLEYTSEQQLELVHVNVLAMLHIALESAKALVKQKKSGVILNVSSAADCLTFPGLSVYSATKAFVTSVSSSLYYEMLPHNVYVLASCPGVVSTGFRKRASEGHSIQSKSPAMSVEYAVERLWNQIQKKKKRDVFDWKTRFGLFLTRILPEKWVVSILSNSIRKK